MFVNTEEMQSAANQMNNAAQDMLRAADRMAPDYQWLQRFENAAQMISDAVERLVLDFPKKD